MTESVWYVFRLTKTIAFSSTASTRVFRASMNAPCSHKMSNACLPQCWRSHQYMRYIQVTARSQKPSSRRCTCASSKDPLDAYVAAFPNKEQREILLQAADISKLASELRKLNKTLATLQNQVQDVEDTAEGAYSHWNEMDYIVGSGTGNSSSLSDALHALKDDLGERMDDLEDQLTSLKATAKTPKATSKKKVAVK